MQALIPLPQGAPQSAHADKERSREGIQRRHRLSYTLFRGFITVAVEDSTVMELLMTAAEYTDKKVGGGHIPPSPLNRSGTLRIHACGDCAPCADGRRKPSIREKACRGTRKPHPQRARHREQGGVVHFLYLSR